MSKQIHYASKSNVLFGTVVDYGSQFGLGRALYMPDELNLHIWAGEKKKVSPRHFPTVVPER